VRLCWLVAARKKLRLKPLRRLLMLPLRRLLLRNPSRKSRVAGCLLRLTLHLPRLLPMQQLLRLLMLLLRLPAAKYVFGAQKSQPARVGFFYAQRKAGRWGYAYFGLSKLT